MIPGQCWVDISAKSQPNEAPFSLPGWPLMQDAHSTCSIFQWILTLALCLSLAVSTFLGFWGSRDMLGPTFAHLCLLHFSASACFLWWCQNCYKPPFSIITPFPVSSAVCVLLWLYVEFFPHPCSTLSYLLLKYIWSMPAPLHLCLDAGL